MKKKIKKERDSGRAATHSKRESVAPKRKRSDVVAIPVQALEPLNAVKSPGERHRERMANYGKKRPPVNDKNKQELIERMRMGELPMDICDRMHMPPFSAFKRAMADDAFADEYAQAFSTMAEMILLDAKQFARDAAETGNIDQMRIADMYNKSMIHSLEKLSPHEFGPLLKHAGAEGGPLQVQVISYAKQ